MPTNTCKPVAMSTQKSKFPVNQCLYLNADEKYKSVNIKIEGSQYQNRKKLIPENKPALISKWKLL